MITAQPDPLTPEDVSTAAMVAGNEKRFTRVIVAGRIVNWIGFGWVDEGPASEQDAALLSTVVGEVVQRPVLTRD